jgi:DNA methylase
MSFVACSLFLREAIIVMTETPNQVHGRLLEGVHLAGYTFERACENLEWLLKEDRWREVGTRYDNVNEFLAGIRLDEFRVITEKRKRLAALIKQLQPEASNRTIAKMVGVSEITIRRDGATNVAPSTKFFNDNSDLKNETATNVAPLELTGAEAAVLAKRRAERKARDGRAEQDRLQSATIIEDAAIEIRMGDFRGVLADLADVDAIICDPPYGKEHLTLLHDLAAFADRALKPDGILAVLFGQTYLPEAFAMLSGFRPYRWTACYLTEGNGYISHARKVQSNWKPLLIYGGCEQRFSDLFKSQGDVAAKDRHHWGQNYDAFKDIIERLTRPGELIIDPFLGGGTTLLAARAAGRKAVGCDIDPQAIAGARATLSAAEVIAS